MKSRSQIIALSFIYFSGFCLAISPDLIVKVKPAVVTTYVYNELNEMISQGSGFFLSENMVVSSRHVFWKKEASRAEVATNGKITTKYTVKAIVVDDIETDLVLLAVDKSEASNRQEFMNISLGALWEGQDVFTISSPAGLKGVISPGIISAIHNEYDIQFTCPISTGSSGGPIFNQNGEVVGIVIGHFTTGQNLNFGISVKGLFDLIKKK